MMIDRDLDVLIRHKTYSSSYAFGIRNKIVPNGVTYTIHEVTQIDKNGRPTQTITTDKYGLDNFRNDSRLVGNYLSMTNLPNSTVPVGYQYINPSQVRWSFNNPNNYKLIKKVGYKGNASYMGSLLDFTPVSEYKSSIDGNTYYYPAVGPYCNGGSYDMYNPFSSEPQTRQFTDASRNGGVTVDANAEYFLVLYGNPLACLQGKFPDVPSSQFYDIGNFRDDLQYQLLYKNINMLTSKPNTRYIQNEINSLAATINSNYSLT